MLAGTAGWRCWMPVTSVPICRRLVACASALSVIHPSGREAEGSALWVGYKWSEVQPDLNISMPSATCHTFSVASQVVFCGEALKAIRIASTRRDVGHECQNLQAGRDSRGHRTS